MKDSWNYLKRPLRAETAVEPEVSRRVADMLLRIEREGADALRHYARELDGWDRNDFLVPASEIGAADAETPDEFKQAFARSIQATGGFAEHQLSTLVDSEWEPLPGVVVGQKQVPISHAGAYLPGGRYPLIASPLMTVLVPKVAGVERVVACTPPGSGGKPVDSTMLYCASACGADAIFAIGGVPALAAMAFGIEGMGPVDIIVGAGNVYVAEAKRQLFGLVGIDLLAGPSEVSVICDETADPELVAADLLAQAEHGPTSPSSLVTTSEEMARRVLKEIERQIPQLVNAEIVAAAWRDYGLAVLAADREEAVAISDEIAAEHLEVQTADDDWYFARLRNYGSLFLGQRATVAYSDKGLTGTNHTLPTRSAARYTGGLSVAKFVKTLTYQRVTSDEATRVLAPAVIAFDRLDKLQAHERTAALRLERLESSLPA